MNSTYSSARDANNPQPPRAVDVPCVPSKLPAISTCLVAIVLCAVPFASRFTPDPSDPGTGQIQSLVIFAGLLVACLSIIPVYMSFGGGRSWHRTAMLYAASLACFAIGWRCIPYWATGVYARDLGLFPSTDMDPKRLAPMIWIGEIWRLGVLLLALVTGVSAPILAGFAVKSAIRNRWLEAFLTFACVFLACGFHFWFQNDYGIWLMD